MMKKEPYPSGVGLFSKPAVNFGNSLTALTADKRAKNRSTTFSFFYYGMGHMGEKAFDLM